MGVWLRLSALLAACAAGGCLERPELSGPSERRAPPAAEPIAGGGEGLGDGAVTALSVMTWNLCWFGDPERDPADDQRQRERVRSVLARYPMDLIALQEISAVAELDRLLAALPRYSFARTAHDWPQQMALLYDVERFSLEHAGQPFGVEHAGRPPLAVDLLDRESGQRLHVVVVHAKARAEPSAWRQRKALALALAAHLEGQDGAAAALVLGDFNDEMTGSIAAGLPSPYVELARRLRVVTAELEVERLEPSTVWGSIIDHVMLGPALAGDEGDWSSDVLRDELVSVMPSFSDTVSDHFPVVVRIRDDEP